MGQLAALSRINSPSGRGRQALGLLLQHSPFLQFMEQNSGWELEATKFNFQPEDISEKTIAARAIGAGAQSAAQDIAVTNLISDILAAYNANFDVDQSYVADVERKLANMDAYMTKELRRRIKWLAIKLENECFLGSGSDNKMKGLKTILDGSTALPGYTGVTRVENAQIITGGSTKSCDLTVRTNDEKLVEQMRLWLAKVPGCTGILCSPLMGARLDTIARKQYAAGETRDLFGKPVTTFNGVPIVPVLDSSITNTEPDDTATPLEVTTSIYLVAPSEESLSLVTNSGLEYTDFDKQDAKQSNREKMEVRLKWKIENPDSILRIRNFKV